LGFELVRWHDAGRQNAALAHVASTRISEQTELDQ